MNAMTNEISTNVTAWAASLPNRYGWTGWQEVGQGMTEGVQNWSAFGDEQRAIGVWGNVVEGDEDNVEHAKDWINWCVYEGDSREPMHSGFDSAEAAMDFCESRFPWMFAETKASLIPFKDEAEFISATSVQNAVTEEPSARWEVYRLQQEGVAKWGWLAISRQYDRAAIAWGADAQWTDAHTAEEALWRWENEEMVN